jgi:hypothetical protein
VIEDADEFETGQGGVRVERVTEERVHTALDSLLRAMSGFGADMSTAAALFMQRGNPFAEPPTVPGVLVDLQIAVWWLANQLNVDIRADLVRRLSGYRETAVEAIANAPEPDYEPPPPLLRSALADRCLFLIGTGVALRREPTTPPRWSFQKASFPNDVVRELASEGLVTFKEDGATSAVVVITPRGTQLFRKLLSGAETDAIAAGDPSMDAE